MQILHKSENISDRQAFQMTHDNSEKLSNNAGRTFDVAGYVHYLDADKKTGEDREMMVILTGDGDTMGTNSKTVIESLLAMLGVFDLPIEDVQIVEDVNKRTGRTFYKLSLV
jgi:hypothetical protein